MISGKERPGGLSAATCSDTAVAEPMMSRPKAVRSGRTVAEKEIKRLANAAK